MSLPSAFRGAHIVEGEVSEQLRSAEGFERSIDFVEFGRLDRDARFEMREQDDRSVSKLDRTRC